MAQEIRSFLAGNRIPYTWQVSHGGSLITSAQPAELIVLADGVHRLANPSLRALAEAFGFQTKPARNRYDLVIIGAGPAGMVLLPPCTGPPKG